MTSESNLLNETMNMRQQWRRESFAVDVADTAAHAG